MDDSMKAAYVFAQAVLMNAEIAGMVAENSIRAHRGESPAYGEDAFVQVVDRYLPALGHNAILSL